MTACLELGWSDPILGTAGSSVPVLSGQKGMCPRHSVSFWEQLKELGYLFGIKTCRGYWLAAQLITDLLDGRGVT